MYLYYIPCFMAEKYSVVQIYHVLLIHSSIDEHSVCFYFSAIMNNVPLNLGGVAGHLVTLYLTL